MGAVLQKYEKRKEYQPYVDELNDYYHRGYTNVCLHFNAPVEEWRSLDNIRQLIATAKRCQELHAERERLLNVHRRLYQDGFVTYLIEEGRENWYREPDVQVAHLQAIVNVGIERETAWPARSQLLKAIPNLVLFPSNDPIYKRCTDDQFYAYIQTKQDEYKRTSLLSVAADLVRQGYLPVVDWARRDFGYDSVPDLEAIVQQKLRFREYCVSQLAKQFEAEFPPEEGHSAS